jgi:diguanylate cyclase (GGDEF)-like protein
MRSEGSILAARRSMIVDVSALGVSEIGASLPVVAAISEALESGVLMMLDDEVVLANQALSAMVGASVPALHRMSPSSFVRHLASLVDDAPDMLQAGEIFPADDRILCEEFEIARPVRSVVRWVARRLFLKEGVVTFATATDITTEVDLVAAQQRMALTDQLTGLVNRRGMEAALVREVARSRRADSPMSVLICDIDHFKQINDTLGHPAGDSVLRQVGRCLAGAVRTSDVVARWGGEEFLLLLPDTPIEGARICAEHVRQKVATAITVPTSLTMSFGCAEVETGETAQAAVARADARLYQAKTSGRNCVR